MAVRVSIATGNFTTAGTWGLVDSTSYLNSENATESLLTTAYSATRSSGFTPGAITVSHIGVKLCERIGTTGTISVSLRNATLGLDDFVTGTEVTINVSDLPSALEADLNGGWILFKLATPILLLAATSYNVQAKTSSATQVDLWCDATVDNISRALITTTTGAPAAGDDLIIAGEKTGAGTENNFVVTMDNTASTDFGSASTSLVTPAIAICDGGILRWGVAAATAYQLKVSGNIITYSGGEYDQGTTSAKMPHDSTAELIFDCAANVDFGFTVRNLSTWIPQGNPRTSGKNIYYCKLNTDEAIASTSLGVDADTGWLNDDVIAVASTTRTAADCESGTLNGNAGASSLTVDGFAGASGGLAVAHSGTSPTQAEVILLTRNVIIRGASASLQAYIDIKATAIVDCDWAEFKWLGSATALKRGINTACTTGIQSFQYCSLHNFEVTGSMGINMTGATGTGLTYSNNVSFFINDIQLQNVPTTGSSIFDGNIWMRTIANAVAVTLGDSGCVFTNNTVLGSTGSGMFLSEVRAVLGTFSDNVFHSNTVAGLTMSTGTVSGTMSNISVWRNNSSSGGFFPCSSDLVISNLVCFGNLTANISLTAIGRLVLINPVLSGDTTFATIAGIIVTTGTACAGELIIINGDFGTVTGIKTAHTNDIDLTMPAPQEIFFRAILINTKLASGVEVLAQTSMTANSYISSQKHDQTAGLHKTLRKYGTITIDTTTTQAGGHSTKMTPNNASFKLESIGPYGGFKVNVASGQTCTPTIYVYEDASYNGARSRFIVKRNDAMGITADTVLDTATGASDAAWEGLTGTTAAVTDDGTLEFVVDCDGTAGSLFVDSFSATAA